MSLWVHSIYTLFFVMMKSYFPYIFMFFCVSIFAQGEANIWYFGVNAGLDFNTNPPTPLLDLPTTEVFSSEGCSTISDSNGNLLFYTNGEKVWNKNYQLMLNGDELYGHNSSTQSSAIIPYPGTYNFSENRFDKYFLVTLDQYIVQAPNTTGKGVCYSEIDMTMDNGFGAVTLNKNIHLFGTTTTEKVCVVPHSNGCDYWVICKVVDSTDFYVYHISSSGFNTTPVISSTSFFVDARPGQMKVSPNNKLLSYVVPNSSIYGGFYVFNFDNSTGLITEKFSDTTNENQYGTAFSPDSKVLYKCGGNRIYQYDVTPTTNDDFVASKITFTSATSGLLSMQLAPDGKIYIARPTLATISSSIGVINNPNTLGEDCNYVAEQQNLGGRFSLAGLPNQLNNLKPHNEIIIGDENCYNVQPILENNTNITSYNWGLAQVTNPQTLISTSTDAYPSLYFPNPNEDYLITCTIISNCYSNTYELLFSPNTIDYDYITPTFMSSTVTYCQNQTPNPLPITSSEGIAGTWSPNTIDTSSTGVFTYEFTPNPNQCAYPITIEITINPAVSISFANTTICEGEAINFPDTNSIIGTWFPASVSNTNSQTYTFTPDDDCGVSTQWMLIVGKKQFVSFNDITICEGENITFPSSNGINGTWFPATISSTQSEIYTFTPNDDCSQPTTWEVTVAESFTDLSLSTFNNTIIANVANVNNLLIYQLNNGSFQYSNVFENVPFGCHSITVTDIHGCTNLSSSIFIFDYPKFFTPNEDGINDYWNINLKNTNTKLYVFDRYGKLLKQIRQNEIGWDGTYNGQKLPATDYWFVLEYEECGIQKTFKSHFSLMR